MSNDQDYVERTTVRSSPAGWWIAATVAIVAVFGLVFVFATQNRQTDLQAAREQGAAEATVQGAATDAQAAAVQASQAAQSAVDANARASQHAAEAAQVAANQTAQATQDAGEAARDASATEPAPQQ